MIEETYAQVKGLLAATRLPVYETALVSDGDALVVATYLILDAPMPAEVEGRYAQGPADGLAEFDIDLRIVGATHLALLKAIDRVRAAVIGKTITVNGRGSSALRLELGKPDLDRSVKPGLFFVDTGIMFNLLPGGG